VTIQSLRLPRLAADHRKTCEGFRFPGSIKYGESDVNVLDVCIRRLGAKHRVRCWCSWQVKVSRRKRNDRRHRHPVQYQAMCWRSQRNGRRESERRLAACRPWPPAPRMSRPPTSGVHQKIDLFGRQTRPGRGRRLSPSAPFTVASLLAHQEISDERVRLRRRGACVWHLTVQARRRTRPKSLFRRRRQQI